MTKVTVPDNVKVGDEFNVRTGILAKIGMAFSLFSSSSGERIGSARVVADHHHDPSYTNQPSYDERRSEKPGPSNMADHQCRMRVEHRSE